MMLPGAGLGGEARNRFIAVGLKTAAGPANNVFINLKAVFLLSCSGADLCADDAVLLLSNLDLSFNGAAQVQGACVRLCVCLGQRSFVFVCLSCEISFDCLCSALIKSFIFVL